MKKPSIIKPLPTSIVLASFVTLSGMYSSAQTLLMDRSEPVGQALSTTKKLKSQNSNVTATIQSKKINDTIIGAKKQKGSLLSSKSNTNPANLSAIGGAGNTGGGAGIEIDGVFYTLAEAGLKLDESENQYSLDLDTIGTTASVLKEIENILPVPDRFVLRKITFGGDHIYKRLAVIDPEVFSAIQAKYQAYVSSLPVQGKFKLVAYTGKDKVTYLLPDWNNTPALSRALFLLTHEASFSIDPNADLANVLKFEIAVLELHQSAINPDSIFNVYRAMARLGLLSQIQGSGHIDSVVNYYIRILEQKGIDVRLGNLFSREDIQSIVQRNPGRIETDLVELNASRGLDKNFFETFRGTKLILHGNPFTNAFCSEIVMNESVGLSEVQIDQCTELALSLKIKSNLSNETYIVKPDGSPIVGISFLR